MIEKTESRGLRRTFKHIYRVYQFVAKVFLYSILLILILVAIGFTAYFVDLAKNIKNGVNKQPLLGAYIIITPSMVPTIRVEDAIIIMRKEPEEFKLRDIITFTSSDPRYSGLTITHRIVGIQKMDNGQIYFRTKGDNNNTPDKTLVPANNVYGKVILKIPKIGYLQYILTQAYGWILLVVVPCLGIVIYDIYKLFKSITKSVSRTKDKTKYYNDNNNNFNNNYKYGGKNNKYKYNKYNNQKYNKKNRKKARSENEII